MQLVPILERVSQNCLCSGYIQHLIVLYTSYVSAEEEQMLAILT